MPASWRSRLRHAKNGVDDAYCSAGRGQLREAERERAQLADEPGLADARLADELDDAELRACAPR